MTWMEIMGTNRKTDRQRDLHINYPRTVWSRPLLVLFAVRQDCKDTDENNKEERE